MNFVNINGEPLSVSLMGGIKKKPSAPKEAKSYHNGWRVQGIPPGALEAAKKQYAADLTLAQAGKAKPPKAWDEEAWLMNAKRKPVRPKPYEVPEAAQLCKQLAERDGWLRVEVVEMKKEVSAA